MPIFDLYVNDFIRHAPNDAAIDFSKLGMGGTTPALSYGQTFRKHKKILDEGLKKTVIQSYRPVQMEKVNLFLNQLLKDPAGFHNHCKE
jgi:hypothetical protein